MSQFEFGIYIHWPFCAAKCPYCDFNSHVRSQIPEADWLNAIGSELDFAATHMIPAHAVVTSVFFGGGTPSLIGAASVSTALDRIIQHWTLSPNIEISLEANPSSADAGRFRDYRAAGINRLSIGVQSLDDDALRFLGRLHDSAEARRAVAFATRAFDRVSIDLIYGRPGQSTGAWSVELDNALSLGTEHLSLYQLTIEDGTPFSARVRAGTLLPLPDEPAAELYEETQEIMDRAGLPAYEISNHARAGRECRHNLLYWRYGSYLGVGPGAHGRINRERTPVSTITERNPERWLARVADRGNGFDAIVPLTQKEAAREHLLMSLRLREGIDCEAYRARWQQELNENAIQDLEDANYLVRDGVRVVASLRGRLVLNAVIAAMVNDDHPAGRNVLGAGLMTTTFPST
jgi:oxygen-independent coproporphyrinogen-3 oxidase